MMQRHASDIALAYGGNTIWLKPSLRAATNLEALHGGFPALLSKLHDFDTATIREIIRYAAPDRAAAQTLLNALSGASLRTVQQVTLAPAFALLTALMTPVSEKITGEAARASTGKAVAWSDLYADLYKIATGWLGWTPDTAWNATLPEILNAFDGHIDQLKAVHGSSEDQTTSAPTMSNDQRQANIDAGLDPNFDRAGLHALKAKMT
ncbi:hypothetical protein [Sulfitobacter sp. PM12]|uniref:hypothetical protein n=1 Tax=Sulfitobacter sp. PM12 TaxID=3138497 RepID=UPI0038903FAD